MCILFYLGGEGVNGLGYGVDHLLPFSDKAKNNWMCTSTPPICPNGVDRDNFIINFANVLYVSVTSVHFVPTSITLSRNTLLSKLAKVVLSWVNFCFPFFCVNRIKWEMLQKLCIVAHLSGKFHLNGRR